MGVQLCSNQFLTGSVSQHKLTCIMAIITVVVVMTLLRNNIQNVVNVSKISKFKSPCDNKHVAM